MKPYSLLAAMILLAVPAMATPAVGQSTARGQATLEVGEVLVLEVVPGDGVALPSGDGAYRELQGAVTLRVLANQPWQLFVILNAPDGRVAAVGGAGPVERAVWWRRNSGPEAPEGEFRRAERSPVLVSSGAGGLSRIELDYRWLDDTGRELEPGTTLHFMLAAR